MIDAGSQVRVTAEPRPGAEVHRRRLWDVRGPQVCLCADRQMGPEISGIRGR